MKTAVIILFVIGVLCWVAEKAIAEVIKGDPLEILFIKYKGYTDKTVWLGLIHIVRFLCWTAVIVLMVIALINEIL